MVASATAWSPRTLVALSAEDGRPLSGFTEVNASATLRVFIAIGDDYSVRLEGRDINRVVADMEGTTLRISRRWSPVQLRFVKVHVTTPRVNALAAAAAASIKIADVEADTLALRTSAAGSIRASNLRAEKVTLRAFAGSSIRVSGTCQNLFAAAGAGARIDAEQLQSEDVNVEVFAGFAKVHARRALAGSASSGGFVHVSGDPPQRSAHARLGGQVIYN